jgi:Family of unknown function (DUF6535)
MIMVFIAEGNGKMFCSPIAANALIIAQMSYDLMGVLNGTHNATQQASLQVPPPPILYRPNVSIWINVIWTISLAFSITCTFLGWSLRRWAFRYLLHASPHIDSRDPRQLQAIEELEAFRPSTMIALVHFLLPLSVFLFYVGAILFMIHTDVSTGLAFVSILVIVGIPYVFFFPTYS